MLSYRKSQQVLLAEKLKKKNVIHVLGVSGSGTTMARLCLSAFARVATGFLRVYRQRRPLCLSAFARVATHPSATDTATCFFASAHSRGLRHVRRCNSFLPVFFASAHSRGLRRPFQQPQFHIGTLPQRIRAGCDVALTV